VLLSVIANACAVTPNLGNHWPDGIFACSMRAATRESAAWIAG